MFVKMHRHWTSIKSMIVHTHLFLCHYEIIQVSSKKNKKSRVDQSHSGTDESGKIEMGTANFVFPWTSNTVEHDNHRYFPIKMSHEASILFSGFRCYHHQHRTNNDKFLNYASYQNRAFYHKLQRSIIRCILPDPNQTHN